MNITIEKKNFEKLNIEPLKAKCGQALDAIWRTDWLNFAITKRDRQNLTELTAWAEKFAAQSDIVVVLADGLLAKLISAAVSASVPQEEKTELLIFGDTLSPADYAELFSKLKNRSFSLLAAADEEESLQLRGAYVTLKQLLISSVGKEAAAERIFVIAGPKSRFFAEEAASEDLPLISNPDFPAAFAANTAAVLLPLAIKGVNLGEYLDGFYEMLASPAWDLDAVDYAVGKAACTDEEILQTWQRQLAGIIELQGRGAVLPAGKTAGKGPAFETLLLIEKDSRDVMMPYFEGCNEDGSLNLLLTDTAHKYFDNENPGVKLSIESMNDYNLGQLLGFFQLSGGIYQILSMY